MYSKNTALQSQPFHVSVFVTVLAFSAYNMRNMAVYAGTAFIQDEWSSSTWGPNGTEESEQNCTCPANYSGSKCDATDCRKFVMCGGPNNGPSVSATCPLGFYSTKYEGCGSTDASDCGSRPIPSTPSTPPPAAAPPPTCNTGLYADPTNCTRFYQCSNGNATLLTCPSPLTFNPSNGVCDWPKNSNCTTTS